MAYFSSYNENICPANPIINLLLLTDSIINFITDEKTKAQRSYSPYPKS